MESIKFIAGGIIILAVFYYLYHSMKNGDNKGIGSGIYSGVALYGRFQAVLGVVIGVIISIILISYGISRLHDPHTSDAQMNITEVSACNQQMISGNKGNTYAQYSCNISVSFIASNGNKYNVSNINVNSSVPLKVGMSIYLRYDPSNPSSVVQEISPRTLGWGLIAGGILVSAIAIGIAVLSFKYKGFAAVEGTASLASSIFNR